jgi:hypothetical protein
MTVFGFCAHHERCYGHQPGCQGKGACEDDFLADLLQTICYRRSGWLCYGRSATEDMAGSATDDLLQTTLAALLQTICYGLICCRWTQRRVQNTISYIKLKRSISNYTCAVQ